MNVVAVCEDMDDVAVDAGHRAGGMPSSKSSRIGKRKKSHTSPD
jgi:hypothetical protein